MRKIASTSELQHELLQIIAYSEGARPSRERIASALESLSTRLGGTKRASGEGDEFAALMKEEWNGVHYDPKNARGSLHYPPLGTVEFQESGNDPAVVVTIKGPIRIKDHPDSAAATLEKLKKILDDSGL